MYDILIAGDRIDGIADVALLRKNSEAMDQVPHARPQHQTGGPSRDWFGYCRAAGDRWHLLASQQDR